jgi:hypothetical protein
VELLSYHGGVSSIQGLRHVGLSSTSFSSVPCCRRIMWMSTASMGRHEHVVRPTLLNVVQLRW